MKNLIAGILCALLLDMGCAPEAVKGYVVGQESKATMGSTMIWWSQKGNYNSERGVWEQLKKELIYSGISGTTLKLSYREYKESFVAPFDETARLPNSLELMYDISTDKEISYQDMRILVISADSKGIIFKVMSDSN
jgi:hypothetical protein